MEVDEEEKKGRKNRQSSRERKGKGENYGGKETAGRKREGETDKGYDEWKGKRGGRRRRKVWKGID